MEDWDLGDIARALSNCIFIARQIWTLLQRKGDEKKKRRKR